MSPTIFEILIIFGFAPQDGLRRRMVDGEVKFLLPGEGALDLSAYFLAMRKTGTKLPVTVEVSGMVWNSEDYDPWEAARACYEVLEKARG